MYYIISPIYDIKKKDQNDQNGTKDQISSVMTLNPFHYPTFIYSVFNMYNQYHLCGKESEFYVLIKYWEAVSKRKCKFKQ